MEEGSLSGAIKCLLTEMTSHELKDVNSNYKDNTEILGTLEILGTSFSEEERPSHNPRHRLVSPEPPYQSVSPPRTGVPSAK